MITSADALFQRNCVQLIYKGGSADSCGVHPSQSSHWKCFEAIAHTYELFLSLLLHLLLQCPARANIRSHGVTAYGTTTSTKQLQ